MEETAGPSAACGGGRRRTLWWTVEATIRQLLGGSEEVKGSFLKNGGWNKLQGWLRHARLSNKRRVRNSILILLSDLPVTSIAKMLEDSKDLAILEVLEMIVKDSCEDEANGGGAQLRRRCEDVVSHWLAIYREKRRYQEGAEQTPEEVNIDPDMGITMVFEDEKKITLQPDEDRIWWKMTTGEDETKVVRMKEEYWLQLEGDGRSSKVSVGARKMPTGKAVRPRTQTPVKPIKQTVKRIKETPVKLEKQTPGKPKENRRKLKPPAVIYSSLQNAEETVQAPSTVITSKRKASDGGAPKSPPPQTPEKSLEEKGLEEKILLVKQLRKERDSQTLKAKLVEVDRMEGTTPRNAAGSSLQAIICRSPRSPPPTYRPVNTMTSRPPGNSMTLEPAPPQKPPPPSTPFNYRIPIRRGNMVPILSSSKVATQNLGMMTTPSPTSQALVPVRETHRFLRNPPSASTFTSQACVPYTSSLGNRMASNKRPLSQDYPMPRITYPYPPPSYPVASTPSITIPPPQQSVRTCQPTALAMMPSPPPTVHCAYAPAPLPLTWITSTSTYYNSSQLIPTHGPPPPPVPTSCTLPQVPVPPGFYTERFACAPAPLPSTSRDLSLARTPLQSSSPKEVPPAPLVSSTASSASLAYEDLEEVSSEEDEPLPAPVPSTSRGDLNLAISHPLSSTPREVPPPPPDPVPSTLRSVSSASQDLENISSEEDEPLHWTLRKIYLRKTLCQYRHRSPSREPPLTNTVEFSSEDMKNCESNTTVFDRSKWRWPKPKQEDRRHPVRLINVRKRKPEKPSPLVKLYKSPQSQKRRKLDDKKEANH